MLTYYCFFIRQVEGIHLQDPRYQICIREMQVVIPTFDNVLHDVMRPINHYYFLLTTT